MKTEDLQRNDVCSIYSVEQRAVNTAQLMAYDEEVLGEREMRNEHRTSNMQKLT